MAFEIFKTRVGELVRNSNCDVTFRNNEGIYFADCSDGTVITGNADSAKIGIKFA